jgi:short-subunit dehydrogenase
VNISSLNGIMAQPGLGAYCTSKFAVRGFTDTLRSEMIRQGRPVQVTGVYPGGVKTNISSSSTPQLEDPVAAAELQKRLEIYDSKLFTTTAEQAATIILDGVEKRRPRVFIGDARKVDRIIRVVPGAYPRLVAAWDKRTFGS